jgi:hypothetical protein
MPAMIWLRTYDRRPGVASHLQRALIHSHGSRANFHSEADFDRRGAQEASYTGAECRGATSTGWEKDPR